MPVVAAAVAMADLIKADALAPPGADALTFQYKSAATPVTLAEDGSTECIVHAQSACISSGVATACSAALDPNMRHGRML